MFIFVEDIKEFCDSLTRTANTNEDCSLLLSREEFSFSCIRGRSVQLRKKRNDGRWSNVFIDISEVDVIVGVVKKFGATKNEPITKVPNQWNPCLSLMQKFISEDLDKLDILDILDIGRMNNMGQQGTQEWQTEVFRSSLVRWEIKHYNVPTLVRWEIKHYNVPTLL